MTVEPYFQLQSNSERRHSKDKLYTLRPLFMHGVQLPQGYRAFTRKQFTFYH